MALLRKLIKKKKQKKELSKDSDSSTPRRFALDLPTSYPQSDEEKNITTVLSANLIDRDSDTSHHGYQQERHDDNSSESGSNIHSLESSSYAAMLAYKGYDEIDRESLSSSKKPKYGKKLIQPNSSDSDSSDNDTYFHKESLQHTNYRTQLQLNIKHLLSVNDRKDDEYMTLCLTTISKQVYDGMYRILDSLIHIAKNRDLEEIYQIIKNLKLTKETEIKDNKHEEEEEQNLFHKLSTESIANICNFLNRREIDSFKMVCYDVSMVCLQHMNKYTFEVCDASKLIQFPSMYNGRYLDNETLMSKEKYHSSTTVGNLWKIWESMYNIPIQYQLPYRCVRKKGLSSRYNGWIELDITADNLVKDIPMIRRSIFLFDIRDIVIFTSNGDTRIMRPEDNSDDDGLSDYALVLLQYFDILEQKLMTIQYLMVHFDITCSRIRQYVENSFIATCNTQRQWYKKFKNDISIYSSKLSLYGGRLKEPEPERMVPGLVYHHRSEDKTAQYYVAKTGGAYRIAKNGRKYQRSLILQISSKKSQSLYEQMQVKHEEHTDAYDVFCDSVVDYDNKKGNPFQINVSFLHNIGLLTALLEYYASSVDTVNMNDIKENICESYTFTEYSCLEYWNIIYQIHKLFHGIVPLEKIQLYELDSYNGDKYKVLKNNTNIRTRIKMLYFGFSEEARQKPYNLRYSISNRSFKSEQSDKTFPAETNISQEAQLSPKNDANDIRQNILDFADDFKEYKQDSEQTEYFIKIFKPNEFIVPVFDERMNYYDHIKNTVSVQYKTNFDTFDTDFLECVMTEISSAKYNGFYDDVIKLYNDNMDHGNISFALFIQGIKYMRFMGESPIWGLRDGPNAESIMTVPILYLVMYHTQISVLKTLKCDESASEKIPITINFKDGRKPPKLLKDLHPQQSYDEYEPSIPYTIMVNESWDINKIRQQHVFFKNIKTNISKVKIYRVSSEIHDQELLRMKKTHKPKENDIIVFDIGTSLKVDMKWREKPEHQRAMVKFTKSDFLGWLQ